jgi:DNA-directed RNA polymerase specialized sigma24 family protein
MGNHDRTDIGGVREAFLTTHWSMIQGVKAQQDNDQALIGLLLARYWKPVYCCIRRKGYANEPAKDLTQGFFHEVVLNRKLVERADPSKGRFRSFLLHALNQYLIDDQRKQGARKRIPRANLVSLDMTDPPSLPQAVIELDDEQCFNHAWKAELLDRVLAELKVWYTDQGMDTHWCLFQDRLLLPSLDDTDPPSLADLCEQYEIDNEVKASNMLGTVKRRFQTVLKEHVRQTVVSGDVAEEELRDIFKFS